MSKKVKLSLIISLIIVAILCGSVAVFLVGGYKADNEAKALLNEENVQVMDGYIRIEAEVSIDVGLIFYPGANVEYTAYLPLMASLADCGITCYLVKMPMNMAIMNVGAADKVLSQHENDHSAWLIGGHSMGGAMASKYASENQDRIDGLILLGAYPYGEYDSEKTIAIYGSLNTSVKDELEAQEYSGKTHVIEGGNHAYFGNYGEQKGDSVGEISREAQQDETVAVIIIWVLDLISPIIDW